MHTTPYSATVSDTADRISETFHPGDLPLLMEISDCSYQFCYYTPPSGHTLGEDDETGKKALLDAVDTYVKNQKRSDKKIINCYALQSICIKNKEKDDEYHSITFQIINPPRPFTTEDSSDESASKSQSTTDSQQQDPRLITIVQSKKKLKTVDQNLKDLLLASQTIKLQYVLGIKKYKFLFGNNLEAMFRTSLSGKESSWKRWLPYVVVGVVALGGVLYGVTLLFRTEESEVEEVKAQEEEEEEEEEEWRIVSP